MKPKTAMTICWIALIPLAVAIILVLCDAKIEAFADGEISTEDFIEETAKEPEKADFEAQSAMPCVDPEPLQRFLETYEQTEDETEAEQVPIYRIAGDLIDPEIQMLLYNALDAEGVSYAYEIGLCQIYQESRGDRFAVNQSNGIDKGILQYRETFWDWDLGDIFDPEAQIRLYSQQMSKRFNSGLSADEAISRHNTSDYVTEVNQTYVAQVKQWLYQMEEVK